MVGVFFVFCFLVLGHPSAVFQVREEIGQTFANGAWACECIPVFFRGYTCIVMYILWIYTGTYLSVYSGTYPGIARVNTGYVLGYTPGYLLGYLPRYLLWYLAILG